jgi:hypothetical protein
MGITGHSSGRDMWVSPIVYQITRSALVEKVDQLLLPLLREAYLKEAWAQCRALQGGVSAPHGGPARAAELDARSGSARG